MRNFLSFLTGFQLLMSLSTSVHAQGMNSKGGGSTQLEARDREDYVYRALTAVSEAGEQDLWSAQRAASQIKSTCRSKMPSIEMDCLLTKQKNFCEELSEEKEVRSSCSYYLDIATINKASESFFLSNHERYKIKKEEQDNGKKLTKAKGLLRFAGKSYDKVLMDRYANLVVKMMLWDGIVCQDKFDLNAHWQCISRKIASFFQVKMAEIKQTWQSCTASLVWFVGNQGHLVRKPMLANSEDSKEP